ncbi:MAG: glycosyltransferase [Nitrososphaerales archaeon]
MAYCQNEISFQKDNVTYRIFPPKTLRLLHVPIGMKNKFSSLSDGETIIHLYGDSNRRVYAFADLFKKLRIPFVIQDLGSPVHRLLLPLQLYFLRKANHIFCVTEFKKKLFSSLSIDPKKMSAYELPSDLEMFRPRDKTESREILGLPQDKFLVLYAGRFNPYEKGLYYVLKACESLRHRIQIEPILIGGRQGDSMYEFVKQRYRYVYPRLPHDDKFGLFYNACDALAYFQTNVRYSGMNVTIWEAMASELPVVSNTLINYPRSADKVGFCVKKPSEIEEYLSIIAKGQFRACGRTESLEYGDYRGRIPETKGIYDAILEMKCQEALKSHKSKQNR